MSRKPTMEDVKNLAGVSISTVSRVINGTRKVSPEKTEAVNRAIEKLGYKPNELARSLVMKKSNTLGIILDDMGYNYMAQYIRGIDEISKLYKYDILLYSTFGNFETQKKAVEFLSSKQVEGIVVISEKINNEVLYLIRDHNIPYILLDPYHSDADFQTVTVDYKKAMYELTDYLISNNHENLAYVKVKGAFHASQEKESGFLARVDSKSVNNWVYTVDENDVDQAYNFMEKNIGKLEDKKITSILFETDKLAIGALQYCYDHNIAVPDKFSITGFGDSEVANLYRPALSTVRLPYYDIGAIAVRLLIKIINGDENVDKSVNLAYQIVDRDTVKKINNK